MTRKLIIWTVVLLLGLGWAMPAAAQAPSINVDTVIASGFDRPLLVTHAGDGSGRLFVVEQPGKIYIIKNGTPLATPFLDLTSQISCCGEQGLLGLAFHPQHAENGLFFVDYTDPDGDTQVVRYSVLTDNPDVANPASAVTLLQVPQPFSNHNAGHLAFGPQGYLYVALGDGGSGGDPEGHGQNRETLLGSILRLDVDNGVPYAIPESNPFVDRAGADEIWLYGLRNPWRFSFDRATGDMLIADVGQGAWEEINHQPATAPGGRNFGWNCREGAHDYQFDGDCNSRTLIDPIAEYSHDEGRSITGGFVYRGADYPALQGYYFYGDYVSGSIWAIRQNQVGTWTTPELLLQSGLNISSFGEDEAGELYLVDYSFGGDGSVRRVTGPPAYKIYLPVLVQEN